MESQQIKTSRKRVANFTADEKALLVQLIKKRPIVESKLTDGKSVAKKQAAWDSITREFNCNASAYKRETITLKRAWDNMKSMARKAHATERRNLIRTGSEPSASPPTPQHEATIDILKVEEVTPVVKSEIKNPFDSDGTISQANDNSQECNQTTSMSIDNLEIMDNKLNDFLEIDIRETNRIISPQIEDEQNSKDNCDVRNDKKDRGRRPSDYIRREAFIRIRHLERKKNIEMQILKTQLEVEQIKKNTALIEEERNKYLLEKAKLELEEIKKQYQNNSICMD